MVSVFSSISPLESEKVYFPKTTSLTEKSHIIKLPEYICNINLGFHVMTANWHVFLSLWVSICTMEISRTGTPFYASQDRFSDTASFLLMEISIVFMLWFHCLCGQRAPIHPAPGDSAERKTQYRFYKFTKYEFVTVLNWSWLWYEFVCVYLYEKSIKYFPF